MTNHNYIRLCSSSFVMNDHCISCRFLWMGFLWFWYCHTTATCIDANILFPSHIFDLNMNRYIKRLKSNLISHIKHQLSTHIIPDDDLMHKSPLLKCSCCLISCHQSDLLLHWPLAVTTMWLGMMIFMNTEMMVTRISWGDSDTGEARWQHGGKRHQVSVDSQASSGALWHRIETHKSINMITLSN